MLPDNVKTQIRAIYKDIATALPNFRPRRSKTLWLPKSLKPSPENTTKIDVLLWLKQVQGLVNRYLTF